MKKWTGTIKFYNQKKKYGFIKYEEVTRCESAVRTGETEDDILADVLEIEFENGTVVELGFLRI